MGDTLNELEKGAALLGLGMKLALKWTRWRHSVAKAKLAVAEARLVASWARVNAVNAKAAARIAMSLKKNELLEAERRENWK